MKLVEIKDVRVGQVWKHNKTGLLHTIDDLSLLRPIIQAEFIARRNDYLKECSLIGFLGITHEIKDEQLVEIPRPKIEVDDIVKIFDEAIGCICNLNKENALIYFSGQNDFDDTDNPLELHPLDDLRKIGILSVTHEFINERSVK